MGGQAPAKDKNNGYGTMLDQSKVEINYNVQMLLTQLGHGSAQHDPADLELYRKYVVNQMQLSDEDRKKQLKYDNVLEQLDETKRNQIIETYKNPHS